MPKTQRLLKTALLPVAPVAALAVLGPAWSWAADEGSACEPAGNQQQMNACAAQDYHAADAELNTRYRALMDSLGADATAQKRLREEQRAWLHQRDPACKRKASKYQGGSVYPVALYGCLQKSTESRTKALLRFKK